MILLQNFLRFIRTITLKKLSNMLMGISKILIDYFLILGIVKT